MSAPPEVPLPSVLDPDRGHLRSSQNTGSPDEQLDALRDALEQASDYGRQLWACLDETRRYLLDSAPGEGRPGASPTSPADDRGWQAWQGCYAGMNAVLAGPRGDNGFGVEEAARQAQQRRHAPAKRPAAAGESGNSATLGTSTLGPATRALGSVGAGVAAALVTLAAGKALQRRLIDR